MPTTGYDDDKDGDDDDDDDRGWNYEVSVSTLLAAKHDENNKNNDDGEDEGRSVESVKERKGVENVKSNERRRDAKTTKCKQRRFRHKLVRLLRMVLSLEPSRKLRQGKDARRVTAVRGRPKRTVTRG